MAEPVWSNTCQILKPNTSLGIFSPHHQDIASDGPKLIENQNQSLSQHLGKSQIKEKGRYT